MRGLAKSCSTAPELGAALIVGLHEIVVDADSPRRANYRTGRTYREGILVKHGSPTGLRCASPPSVVRGCYLKDKAS